MKDTNGEQEVALSKYRREVVRLDASRKHPPRQSLAAVSLSSDSKAVEVIDHFILISPEFLVITCGFYKTRRGVLRGLAWNDTHHRLG